MSYHTTFERMLRESIHEKLEQAKYNASHNANLSLEQHKMQVGVTLALETVLAEIDHIHKKLQGGDDADDDNVTRIPTPQTSPPFVN